MADALAKHGMQTHHTDTQHFLRDPPIYVRSLLLTNLVGNLIERTINITNVFPMGRGVAQQDNAIFLPMGRGYAQQNTNHGAADPTIRVVNTV